jgi:methyl-accepting chemotaxis protein
MLWAVAALSIGLLAVGGAGIAAQQHSRSVSVSFVKNELPMMTRIMQLRATMNALRLTEKDMLVEYFRDSDVSKGKVAWKTGFENVLAGFKDLSAHLVDPAQHKKVEDAAARLGGFKSRFEAAVSALQSEGFAAGLSTAKLFSEAQAEYDAVQKSIETLAADIERDADQRGAQLEKTSSLVMTGLAATVALALLVLVPATWLNMLSIVRPIREAEGLARRIESGDLTESDVDTRGKDEPASLLSALARMQTSLRSMVGQVRSSTDSITTASAEIATGNQDLSVRTEQTASNLQQAASSMTQLTGTVRQSADSARQANQLASSAAEVAARGGKVVSQVVTTMDEINASSKKISDIIGVIDGIAFQTNILALNAAVEAARAGEQGRGFAVVASEVRSLAQRSAQAAKEIKGLIGASVDRVEVGAKLVADAGKTMQEIVGSVQRVTDIIGEITAASSEQSDGIGQVNTAVTQLDQMTQQNAALVEQSAAAAESLREQANKLATAIGSFKLDTLEATARPAAAATMTTHAAKPAAKPAAKASSAVAAAKFTASKPTAAKPTAAKPTTAKPASTKPAAAKPAPVKAPAPAASAAPAAAVAAPNDDWETF